jgi:hypothetical protein
MKTAIDIFKINGILGEYRRTVALWGMHATIKNAKR